MPVEFIFLKDYMYTHCINLYIVCARARARARACVLDARVCVRASCERAREDPPPYQRGGG